MDAIVSFLASDWLLGGLVGIAVIVGIVYAIRATRSSTKRKSESRIGGK